MSHAPTQAQLCAIATGIITRIMEGGEAKHGAHVWHDHETVRHHADRVHRHLATALMIRDGNEPIRDGEDDIAHLERALVRLLFTLYKAKHHHD